MTAMPFRRISQIQSGHEFKTYLLLEQIGEGGQGCVWSALEQNTGQVVAIKFSETPESSEKVSPEDRHIEKQISKLMQLHHPNVLPMVDYGTEHQIRYIVSPYIPGGSLEDVIDPHDSLSVRSALEYATRIASALDYLHQHEIIHRDLKPSNILLDLRENIYLSDFGLARVLSDSTQAMHTGRGTPFYAPPEQHTMSEAVPQSDVYSFGIVLFELLTGQLPWGGDRVLGVQQLHAKEVMPDPREVSPDLPEGLAAILRQMTATLPEARPSSAGRAMELVYQAFNLPPLQVKSTEIWDSATIQNLNAAEIYQQSLRHPASALSLTSFAILDNSPQAQAASQEKPQAMLKTAILYGYHAQQWWQQTNNPKDRLAVASLLLQNEQEPVRQRATRLLAGDEQICQLGFAPGDETVKNILKGIGRIQGEEERSLLIHFLRAALPAGKKWQKTAIGPSEDALLAYQALQESESGRAAAQLIGHLRAENAVQSIFKNIPEERKIHTLLPVLKSAGSLPASLPTYARLETQSEWILSQAFANPIQLLGLALSTLLGAGLGFGLYAYGVYRMVSFLDTARILTSIQQGLFIGAGFALVVPLIRITIERFPQLSAWKRLLIASLPGGIILSTVFLLYHALLLSLYDLLTPSAKILPLMGGCILSAFGFAIASLQRNRLFKIIISAGMLAFGLFGTWVLHTQTASNPFPMLYYEYTWPAGQVLSLTFIMAGLTAIGANLLPLSVDPPAAPPNQQSASSL